MDRICDDCKTRKAVLDALCMECYDELIENFSEQADWDAAMDMLKDKVLFLESKAKEQELTVFGKRVDHILDEWEGKPENKGIQSSLKTVRENLKNQANLADFYNKISKLIEIELSALIAEESIYEDM